MAYRRSIVSAIYSLLPLGWTKYNPHLPKAIFCVEAEYAIKKQQNHLS
jgi:hypothetical protein